MFHLVKFLKPYKKQLILGPLAKLIEAIFELITPLLMASLIDVGIAEQDSTYILRMGLLMALVAIAGLLFALFCQYSASVASQGFGTALRDALLCKINTFSHAEIDRFGTATLVNRSTNDISQLQVAVAMLIRLVIRAPFLCIGGIIMAMKIDFQLSLVLIIFIPLFVLVLYWIMKKTIPLYQVVQSKLDHLSLDLRENLTGVRVVRAFARSEDERRQFDATNMASMEASVRAGRISALLSPATLLIMNIATLAIVWFGGFRVYAGALTQGQLIALINYISQIMLALIVVANLAILFNRAAASAKRINEVFETEPEIKDTGTRSKKFTNIMDVLVSVPVVEFDNVCFSYGRENEYILKNITLKLERGKTIGIIGGTGSGKSTLLHLIARFYDTSKGRILINGTDIKEYELNDLRSNIGIVLQKAVLFSGTIRSNISWGKPNATLQELQQAATLAQASEFIERLPQGYETPVSQGGKNLSGGQKQRLTIARALVKQPKILILDDSSSALDYATDASLRRALKQTVCETTIIASQRVTAVKDADLIILLEDGEIAGIGSHSRLLQNNELYKEICSSQNITPEATA